MPGVKPTVSPPVAGMRPFAHREHGVDRPDPYAWLRETESPEVLAHLAAERAWYEDSTAHLLPLIASLRAEMAARLSDCDDAPHGRLTRFSYYTRLPAGSEYPQLLRNRDTETALQEPGGRGIRDADVILDANLLDTGSGYVELGLTEVSPDERLLAYSVDTTGDEVYALRFRDLDTGVDLAEEIPRTYYGGAWGADNATFYYTVHDEAYRPFQVWRHRIGRPPEEDDLVLEEPDQRFELTLHGGRSGDVILVLAESRRTTEVWALDAHDPQARPWSVGGRREGVEYRAEHRRTADGDELLLVTDDGETEFRLARCPVPRGAGQDHSTWTAVRSGEDGRLERADAFADHVVLTVRHGARRRLLVLDGHRLDGDPLHVIEPAFAGGHVELGPNPLDTASSVLVVDQAHTHPRVWSEVDLATGSRREVHRQEAPGHDPSDYLAELRLLVAPGGDARPVPATLVRHRDTPLDGTAPAVLYGYGAYEYTFEPDWDPALPSLLDRGVVYVHAHVRGGGEQGRAGWLDGRMEAKQHTFDDFAAAADALASGLVDGSRIVSRGLSAGGLLQGAAFSQRPDRWAGVVAEVPFVDVVTTLFDADVPLTVNEWEEWGDPRNREDFAWLLDYSPYENPPEAGGRPPLLVTGALHDPRVMVWEPAKWVARLRETDPAWSPRCVFRVELGAGSHVGPSGRFAHLGYEAEVAAWMLERMGLA